ncbi:hypothetical protein FQA39_LY00160 [Lamprigera yunnana]|nr:hypothetical protein FQA39_LY00160 [Lamprigera yunnana]
MNGDALSVKLSTGQNKKVFLSSIRPPKEPGRAADEDGKLPARPKGFRPLYDIPYMLEAREFLRKKLIGKKVNVVVDYIQEARDSFPEKVCATVTVGGVNVGEALVLKGLATVIKYQQDDDQRSSHYDDLMSAETKAIKSQKGGITCPRTARPATATAPASEAELFGEEALAFTKKHSLQHEVSILVESHDKAGNFIGGLWVDNLNINVALVEEGYATVHPTADKCEYSRQLRVAEDSAKQQKLKRWKDYVKEKEEEQQRIAEDQQIVDRKPNYEKVIVTEITADGEAEDPIVHTPKGLMKGTIIKSLLGQDIYSFRGIRYGKAPVGELRFQPPEPTDSWTDVYNAIADPPACPQPGIEPISEDCLFLNVYSTKLPHKHYNPLRPVLFFIHAGGFYSVTVRSDLMGPQYLLDQDVVVVVINYRLATLGFLSTGDKLAPGNNGLKDQVLALKWVKKNILAFGGNPNSVTIIGYSAGGTSVTAHMLSPMSRGLFHNAVAMSGSIFSQWPLANHQLHLAQKQARLVGCPDDTSENIVKCLKNVSAKTLGDSFFGFAEFGRDPVLIWTPVIELDFGQERFLTEHPIKSVLNDDFVKVPFMAGVTTEEFSYLARNILDNPRLLHEMNYEFNRVAPISFVYERNTPKSNSISAVFRETFLGNGLIDNSSFTGLGQPPAPVSSWSDVYDATRDGPACPQPGFDPTSEDCLFLNVYTTRLPRKSYNPTRPVLFYIHSGGFYSVTGRSDWAGPDYLLDTDVVLVTINYRLGSLGFLSTGDELAPGNNGLKDQVLALKWVEDNILAFGGNPNLVTIFGYSAGGMSVSAHLLSPMSKGLFHRAVSMSDTIFAQWPIESHQLYLAQKQARLVGCPDDTSENIVTCLKTIPANKLGDTLPSFAEFGTDPILIWMPVIETDFGQERFLIEHPIKTVLDGNFAKIPFMTGVTTEEFSYLARNVLEDPQLLKTINEKFDKVAPIAFIYERGSNKSEGISQKLREEFLGSGPIDNSSFDGLGKLYADGVVGFGVNNGIKLIAERNKEATYYYRFSFKGRFSHVNLSNSTIPYGVVHHDDLIYLFHLPQMFPRFNVTDPEYVMVKKLTTLLKNFAYTGNPTPFQMEALDYAQWTPFTVHNNKYMDIGKNLEMKENLYEDRYSIWAKLFPVSDYEK